MVVCAILFAHFSANRHLGYFHLLGTANNAAMNMHVQISFVSLCFQFLCVYISTNEIAESHSNSILS